MTATSARMNNVQFGSLPFSRDLHATSSSKTKITFCQSRMQTRAFSLLKPHTGEYILPTAIITRMPCQPSCTSQTCRARCKSFSIKDDANPPWKSLEEGTFSITPGKGLYASELQQRAVDELRTLARTLVRESRRENVRHLLII